MLRYCKGKVRLEELLVMGDWVLVLKKKKRLSTKVITHSNVAKHSFVVLYIVSCVAAIKLNNFEFKLLSAIFD